MLGKAGFRDSYCTLQRIIFALVFCFGFKTAWAYTVTYDCGIYAAGSIPSGSATSGTNFLPAQNTCEPLLDDASFTGWAVSGTTDIINPDEGAFPWEYNEDKTFTATWSCWPDANKTNCVQGYEIVLTYLPSQGEWYIPPVPDKIYTIYGVGAYLDAGRTEKIGIYNGEYHITPPEKRSFTVNLDTNGPYNPTALPNQVRRVTSPNSITPQTIQRAFFEFEYGSGSPYSSYGGQTSNHRINSSGYLTAVGEQFAKEEQGGTWYANWASYPSMFTPTLTGYTFKGWYDNPEGTGESIAYNTEANTIDHLYAKWEANKYTVNYNLGDFGEWESNSVHPNEATYDTPFEVSHPEPKDPDKYKFAGWRVNGMDQIVTHYYSNNPIIFNNEYQSETNALNGTEISKIFAKYFMNLHFGSGTVNFIAMYECVGDYKWNDDNTECVLNTYTVTYYSGNCDPNNVENLFGNTYSATDSNSAVSGHPYNVLSYTNTSLIGDNFGNMYESVANGGFGVPYACASFHGWNNPNIQETNIDYDNCFSEQNELCTPVIQPYNYDDNLNLYAYCEWGTWNVAYYGCNGELIKTESLKFGDYLFIPSASDISGYTFHGWTFNNGSLGNTFTADLCLEGYNTLNLYADCTQNLSPVNLKWVADGNVYNQNQNTCNYGTGTISGISYPDIPGRTFIGWEVTNWSKNLWFANQDETDNLYYWYTELSSGYCGASNSISSYCPWQSSLKGTWGTQHSYGIINGQVGCSDNTASFGDQGTPTIDNDNGQYCWCRVTSFVDNNELEEVYTNSPWVYFGEVASGQTCQNMCGYMCSLSGAGNSQSFREALFNFEQ